MKTNHHGHKFNWYPDRPDHRDVYKTFRKPKKEALSQSVDLRPQMPPVYNQLDSSSCTANAIAAAFEFEMIKQKQKPFIPSRLFIYYLEREMEGSISTDGGAIIRDGLKVVAKNGVCPEDMWPFVPAKFAEKPPKACYDEALKHQVTKYQRIGQTLNQLKLCLSAGFPIVFGFSVYEAFESDEVAKNGVLHMPQKGEKDCGGHAVCCVGYLESSKQFIVRNSWGDRWGQQGYFLMDYDYVTSPDLASDFWSIELVE